jgi:lipopolysaccharide export system permease protein
MRLVPSILTRYLALSYVRTAIATLLGVVAVVLVVDVADRAYSFRGEGWFVNVVRLYANLSVDLAYQVAPSALLLAAGITVSALRQTGEMTALQSLGNAPGRIVAAVLVACAIGCAGLVVLNEAVVVDASRKADEIKASKFRRSGDFRAYLEPQHWFRSGDRLYNLRGADGEAFTDVSLYQLDANFGLRQRIDAARMTPGEGGTWHMENATVSTFEAGLRTAHTVYSSYEIALPESAEDLRVRAGKPRQMGLFALWEQVRVRERIGVSSLEYLHELHNRLAYPFAAVPGALIAIRLAMRRGRKGHLATALAEGIVISLVVFTLLTVFRALGISGALPPVLAAWTPVLLLALIGVAVGAAEALAERRRPRFVPAGGN